MTARTQTTAQATEPGAGRRLSPTPHTLVAVLTGKGAAWASRRLGRGGGTALPGLLALRLDPTLIQRLGTQLGEGSVLITGTNGKTTTARMVSQIARAAGRTPVPNASGSNLMRGIASALIAQADVTGRIRQARCRLGVFEVDEATLPEAVTALRPRTIAFANLFRDQLDRYGEVDSVAAVWRKAVGRIKYPSTLVLNADDPSVAALGELKPEAALYYGVDDPAWALACPEHAADSRWCHLCGSEYAYGLNFFGHLGHWRCPTCGAARPQPQVRALAVQAEGSHTALQMATPAGEIAVTLPFTGLYNVYNALAALTIGLALGFPRDALIQGLSNVRAAFGRQERMRVHERDVHILLGKNPAGLNQVLRAITAQEGRKNLLLVLNDGIADGRDVSWIWDVDFEMLEGIVDSVVASGTRAEDMALRLKYAGIDNVRLEKYLPHALAVALSQTPLGGRLYVLPTYTALLEVREMLARQGGRAPFWAEEREN